MKIVIIQINHLYLLNFGELLPIYNQTLKDLLPLSLSSTPAVSIRKENKMWVATCMLMHYLESFTDSLVVTEEDEKPIGIIGGKEVIVNIFENPSSDFFDKTTVEQVMDKNLIILSEKIKLYELFEKWKQNKRAFSIIPNKLGGYSAISGRKLLEIGTNCITDMTISELPKKEIITFNRTDTMKDIISLMLQNNTRRLVLKNTNMFISDRLIIQTIAQKFDISKKIKFLDHRIAELFNLEEAKKISKDMNLAEISKIMSVMMHPCIIFRDQIITPWDICAALQSDRIEFLG